MGVTDHSGVQHFRQKSLHEGGLSVENTITLRILTTDPPAPRDGYAEMYLIKNGTPKHVLRIRFPTGAVQDIQVEP